MEEGVEDDGWRDALLLRGRAGADGNEEVRESDGERARRLRRRRAVACADWRGGDRKG